MTAGSPPVVVVHADAASLADACGARLLLALADAQASRGVAHAVLTGGSMGSAILASAGRSSFRDLVDWQRVHLWWGDERFLPEGDPDRNDTQNRAALLDRLPLLAEQVHRVAGPDVLATPDESARRYAAELARFAGTGQQVPEFDVLLLGVGPDGHICSLFPGHPALNVRDRPTAGVEGSPKPPPQRVTLTFPALAAARHTWFLVSGPEKADAVSRAVAGAPTDQVPAGTPRGQESTLWLVDVAAASGLAHR
ncbi:MAG: 6-phosphogluconolactonase [Dermatophilaceae bacterium]